jgi:CDP-diacylglycerol--glycerol-3-phosphate 3-phosphatidyltransferase
MNLPNKISLSRIFMTIIIIFLCLFPFYSININIPQYNVGGVIVDLRYIISGVIFIIASISDFIDGKIARKNNLITDTGKILDAIADKVLVNSVLIIFACQGFIHPIIAVIYIFRDEIVNALRIHAAKNGIVVPAGMNGKIKTFAMMVGLSLMFFYNLPFELINIRVDKFLIYFATIMSVVSGIEYYNKIIKIKKIDK